MKDLWVALIADFALGLMEMVWSLIFDLMDVKWPERFSSCIQLEKQCVWSGVDTCIQQIESLWCFIKLFF